MEKALEHCGNQERFYNAIERGKNGQEITILFMGGSVTRGEFCRKDGFVNQVERNLHRMFGEDFAYTIVNISASGTMSSNGIFMLKEEIRKYNPDIVFVDYSVNDTGDRFLWETFEGVVRNLLQLPSSPGVGILLFSNERGQSAKGIMKVVGEFYRLPIINIADGVFEAIKKGKMTWQDYGMDYVHPNLKGHQLIGEVVCEQLIRASRSKGDPYEMPKEYCFGGHMCNLQFIDQWCPLVDEKKERVLFQGNLEFDMMMIEYMQDSVENAAAVSVEVDGTCVKILDAYLSYGWGNKMVSFICQNGDTKSHFVEIKILQESTRSGWSFADFLCGIALGV